MKLMQAIAMSPGNKARTYSDTGHTIVVQQRYYGLAHTSCWFHIWDIGKGGVVEESDISGDLQTNEIQKFHVDPVEDYWGVIG